jgi:hypothetical protein
MRVYLHRGARSPVALAVPSQRERLGNWVSISAGPDHGGGIGTRVAAFRPGAVGYLEGLIASGQITGSQGYAAGSAPVVHLGQAGADTVDLRSQLPGEDAVDLLA